MMYRVIFPQFAAMEAAMDPIEQEIRYHHEDHGLQPERQCSKRAMAVLVDVHDRLGAMNVEYQRRAQRQHADTKKAREQRDQKPVANVGDDLALAPPRTAGIAGRPAGQRREYHTEDDGDRDDSDEGPAGNFNA